MNILTRKEAIQQNLERYSTGKPCIHGHIAERASYDGKCIACVKTRNALYQRANKEKIAAYNEANKEEIAAKQRAYRRANKEEIAAKQKAYREANKEKIAAKQKAYKEVNKEEIAAKQKAYNEVNKEEIAAKQRAYRRANKEEIAAYREANKEEIAAKQKAYREANKEKIAAKQKAYNEVNKEKRALSQRKYHLTNRYKPMYKATLIVRRVLKRTIHVTKQSKATDAQTALGYSYKEFKQHIEQQFEPWMSWENHAHDTWHIDHIKPVSLFIAEGVTDPRVINALSNLQPLSATENLAKGAKYT